MVLTRGALSLAERGKLGIALCHGAEGMRKQTKELNERQSILYPLKKKEKRNNRYNKFKVIRINIYLFFLFFNLVERLFISLSFIILPPGIL